LVPIFDFDIYMNYITSRRILNLNLLFFSHFSIELFKKLFLIILKYIFLTINSKIYLFIIVNNDIFLTFKQDNKLMYII